MGFITVYLIMCLNAEAGIGCTTLPITNNNQPQVNGAEVNMSGCLGLEGFQTSKKYWDEHPDLHAAYQYKGWACQIGNRAPPEKGHA